MTDEVERHDYEKHCPTSGCQNVNVCVPVVIRPYAKVGHVKVQCVGMPIITQNAKACPGSAKCECCFTISRKIRVEVPVDFGAKTEIGEACIDCEKAACEICSD